LNPGLAVLCVLRDLCGSAGSRFRGSSEEVRRVLIDLVFNFAAPEWGAGSRRPDVGEVAVAALCYPLFAMSVKQKYAHLPPLPAELEECLATVDEIFVHGGVRLAYLFGSMARGTAEPSDVDLAVLPDTGFSWRDIYAALSLHLQTDRLDLVDLSAASICAQFEVVTQGRCLYARSQEEKEGYEQRVRLLFRDSLPRFRARSADLRSRLSR